MGLVYGDAGMRYRWMAAANREHVSDQSLQQQEAAIFDVLNHAFGDRLVVEGVINVIFEDFAGKPIGDLQVDHNVLLLDFFLRVESDERA